MSKAAPRRYRKRPDVRYEPSSPSVVEEMLWLGGVTERDVVYDLGCGDGRLVIAAARMGAHAVGIDVDLRRVEIARNNARIAGVLDRAIFLHADFFEADLREATVVMLYLQPELNLRLLPRLLAQLRPGARIVSHSHDMGDWQPDFKSSVRKEIVYAWVVPAPEASER